MSTPFTPQEMEVINWLSMRNPYPACGGPWGRWGPRRLCDSCSDREWVQAHPVPLPRDPQMRGEIVRLYQSSGLPIPPRYEEIYP